MNRVSQLKLSLVLQFLSISLDLSRLKLRYLPLIPGPRLLELLTLPFNSTPSSEAVAHAPLLRTSTPLFDCSCSASCSFVSDNSSSNSTYFFCNLTYSCLSVREAWTTLDTCVSRASTGSSAAWPFLTLDLTMG
ncbi:hypothetical protein BC629DRAFT_1515617, partial [Irpex lacteus]